MATAIYALTKAIRAAQLADATLAAVGVHYGVSTSEEALPYVINALNPKGAQNRRFGGGKTFVFELLTKVCAKDSGGKTAFGNADPLVTANIALFQDDGTESAMNALNTTLTPLGWRAMLPLDMGPMAPFRDRIGDVERWHFPHRFLLRVEKI